MSLPPGTLPDATGVRILNLDIGDPVEETRVSMTDGGFDPVPIAAVEGDRLELTFTYLNGDTRVEVSRVPPRRPPVLVRTSPARGRTDVSLDVVPAAVFSEPVDPTTLVVGMLLVKGTEPVAGQVELDPGKPWVATFRPSAALEPGTAYRLELTRDVRDLDGDPLESSSTVSFTTAASATTRPPTTSFDTGPDFDPAWSPDGSKIAFASNRTGDREIFVMNADGSGAVNLTRSPGTVDEQPSWSPDGSRIVFSRDRQLFVMNADGSGPVDIMPPGGLIPDATDPEWSPDGSRIAFTATFEDCVGNLYCAIEDAGETEIFVVAPDGSGPMNVTHDANGFEWGAGWSPDGSMISFVHYRYRDITSDDGWSTTADGGISVIAADGSGLVDLTDVESWEPVGWSTTWSPDGTRIAYVRLQQIIILEATTSHRTYLHPQVNTDGGSVAWSPDGTKLLFVATVNVWNPEDPWHFGGRILVMNVDGSGLTDLTARSFTWH